MNKILYPLYLKLRFLLFTATLLLVLVSNAQQDQVYNQFFMNPYIYNPAYAGVDGHPVLFAMYKQQWAKIPESPQLMHVTYHTPLKGGIGIGGTAFRDTQGPLTTTSFKASSSYLINIDRKHFLRLGMSLGLGSNQVTIPEDAIGDPAFQGEGSMFLIGDFGATYHFGHFNAGFALTNLFSSEVVTEKSLSPLKVSPTDNMLFKMNYRGHINHDIAIEPHIIYRISSVVPNQYEIATIVHLKHIAWVGGTYRQYSGMVGLVGAKFNNKFAVGAAFELGSSDYGDLTGSSFEIHIGMHLGGHQDHKRSHIDHHSSFLRTHSEELLEKKRREDALKAQQEIQDLQNSRDPDALGLVDTNKEPTTPPADTTEDPKEWTDTQERISRTNAQGQTESGQRLERTNDAGQKEIVMGFAPPRNGGSAWALAPGASQLLERARPNGTKEVGVKWVRIGENGTMEQTIKWEPVLDEAGAKAALGTTIPVDTTPKEEPKEEPKGPDETPDVVVPVVTPSEHIADPTLTTDGRSYDEISDSDEHLEVKRGGHFLELPAGNHIIGGVFDDFDQAEAESDRLFHRGMRDMKVGYVSARGHYYVVVGSFSTVEQAQREKNRIKANYNLKDVWVLKVNN